MSSQALDFGRLVRFLPALESLFLDEAVTEIMVTTHEKHGVVVFFEKKGKLYRASLAHVPVRSVIAACHGIARPLASDPKKNPLIDARLADGSRVAIAVPPAAPQGPAITIRRFSKVTYTGDDLVAMGSVPAHVFKKVVDDLKHGGNVLVAGGTGSGKTTLLNALIKEFPVDDRFVVIEDVVELRLDHVNVVRLEARGAESTGLTPRHMVRHSLRQRPDHIVLGEIRGGEAYDVLQALNTGHGGSLTTIHANSARDALLRVASCALEGAGPGMPWYVVAASVAMAFNTVIYQERRSDRTRGVSEVLKLNGYDPVKQLWNTDTVWAFDDKAAGPAAEPQIVDLASVARRSDSSSSSSSSSGLPMGPPAAEDESERLKVVGESPDY